jgi:hypothetical protein
MAPRLSPELGHTLLIRIQERSFGRLGPLVIAY